MTQIKPKKFNLALTILLLLGGSAWIAVRALMSFSNMNEPQHLPISAFFEIEGQRINLEVAKTHKEQAKGLQFREALPRDRGMLFPVEPERPVSLWMKDVNFSLDLLFLREGIVIEMAEQAPPCESGSCLLYGPDKEVEVDAVLEVFGGAAERLGIEKGDRVEIQFQ